MITTEPVNVELDISSLSLKSLYKIFDDLAAQETSIKSQRKYLKERIQERLQAGETATGNTVAPGISLTIGA